MSSSSMCRERNKHANYFSFVPSKAIDVRIVKKTLRATSVDLIHANPINEQNLKIGIVPFI